LRGIGRNRRRSLSTGMGVVLALTLILASWGMIDTVDILVDRQFDQIERQDAELYVAATDRDVVADIERVAGIERAERVVQAQVTLERNGQQYPTRLIAFGPDTLMHDFGTSGLPSTGLVVGRSLGSVLDVGVGDPVGLSPEGSSASETLPVVAFVDEPLGTLAYTTLPVADAFLTPEAISVMVTFTDDVDRAAMRENLSNLPGVVAYVDSRGLYDAVQSLLSLFYVFVGVMVVFGALMAFALLFNTSLVNVSERSCELAAIHVNGASPGQLTRLLAGENLLLTLMSIVPGLVVGYWVSARFMDSFSSDLFDFGLEIRARTVVLSAVAIIVVSALAQWPTARAVKKLDVARVVRERSQ
ncbi:MAG: ABC transporter permease, partial [Acidimicrobiia bacterium]|nr:ABC transporter permease [Acidimicrobiia bacterium]